MEDSVNIVKIWAGHVRSHETPSLVHFANCHPEHKGYSLFIYSQIYKTAVQLTLYEFCAPYKHITLLDHCSTPQRNLYNITYSCFIFACSINYTTHFTVNGPYVTHNCIFWTLPCACMGIQHLKWTSVCLARAIELVWSKAFQTKQPCTSHILVQYLHGSFTLPIIFSRARCLDFVNFLAQIWQFFSLCLQVLHMLWPLTHNEIYFRQTGHSNYSRRSLKIASSRGSLDLHSDLRLKKIQ
jgi:hypothetical protein